ncbi:LysR substrate-binding domain-containing protein [Rhodoplanes sp. TEM]|uniref:LysR substrate-binding domain-containing protein n=1 Tax=Rhodoplanes tepidamans TaxID=200616 RepID=A0ABT5JC93_RHOTP|nr:MULTISPECIES: LysR substrate-binding domain-containing protein [Rhodoplanes]MDC7787117.1 LysR substrate-binding domain-containing protein [Rhodoplanes tepidamans]MDC7986819.1 LysR substrate-binding domain-containing protein [Rhodoplanes sp. TEM]MDQ0358718.1 DNA-binding transcriptional LysR family regulator [Rhodoplanes tepidamans]
MNDRQMRYFIAVAEQLSFSRAARLLNVSQPPLSMQIKALEEELGAALLVRTRRRVELTEAGRLFLDSARRAVRQMDDAAALVRQSAEGKAGVLRLGFTSSVPLSSVFARVMRSFRATHPRVEIELLHMSTRDQLEALEEDRLDAGILRPANGVQPRAGIVLRPVWRDRLAAFLPEAHPLAGAAGPVAMAELRTEDFVMVSRPIGCGVHEQTLRLCAAAGFLPHVVQESRELTTVLGLVAAGLGVSVLPDCYARVGMAGVVARPLASSDAESRLMLAVRAPAPSPVARRFVAVVQDELRAPPPERGRARADLAALLVE